MRSHHGAACRCPRRLSFTRRQLENAGRGGAVCRSDQPVKRAGGISAESPLWHGLLCFVVDLALLQEKISFRHLFLHREKTAGGTVYRTRKTAYPSFRSLFPPPLPFSAAPDRIAGFSGKECSHPCSANFVKRTFDDSNSDYRWRELRVRNVYRYRRGALY